MVPTPGTSSLARLKENLGARSLRLTEEELDALDRYRPPRAHSLGRRLRRGVRPFAVPMALRDSRPTIANHEH
jgi:diketogulonate reductase-like aldo/keto reductase